MNDRYKLIYFNTKGKAEFIRYIFAYVGQSYEDFRFDYKDWTAYSKYMLFQQVPELEITKENCEYPTFRVYINIYIYSYKSHKIIYL
jgi:hypothetical protein